MLNQHVNCVTINELIFTWLPPVISVHGNQFKLTEHQWFRLQKHRCKQNRQDDCWYENDEVLCISLWLRQLSRAVKNDWLYPFQTGTANHMCHCLPELALGRPRIAGQPCRLPCVCLNWNRTTICVHCRLILLALFVCRAMADWLTASLFIVVCASS